MDGGVIDFPCDILSFPDMQGTEGMQGILMQHTRGALLCCGSPSSQPHALIYMIQSPLPTSCHPDTRLSYTMSQSDKGHTTIITHQ